jgi:hypothetical protein
MRLFWPLDDTVFPETAPAVEWKKLWTSSIKSAGLSVSEHGLVPESGHVVESLLSLGHVECTGRVLHVVDAVTLVVC